MAAILDGMAVRQAWRVRVPPRGSFQFNFQLHRAAGLWLWPALFVFAWSSVGFNLDSVFTPVMRAVSDPRPATTEITTPTGPPALGWAEALPAARRNAVIVARQHGATILRERALYIDREHGSYSYVVRTSRDASDDYANSWFTIDGRSGRVVSIDWPTGEHSGATFAHWLGILHTAGVFGLPWRIFVSLTGAMIVILTITGVLVWQRKPTAALPARGEPPLLVQKAPHLP